MNIKSLTLVYENCEYCKVYKKDIVSIEIKEIGFVSFKYGTFSGSHLEGKKHTSNVEIVVNNNERTSDFGRSDVTHIIIEGKKGEEQHFVVDWAENDYPYGYSSLQSVERKDKTIIFKSVPSKKEAS